MPCLRITLLPSARSLFFAVCFFHALAAPAQTIDLARQRATHLRRGINASEWFAQVHDPKGYAKAHFETWTTSEDVALIKSMGFDHVRLSVNPEPMFRRNQADAIPAAYLEHLDAAVHMILDHGLAVIIDIHPEDDFKTRLSDDEFIEQFADFWQTLASHFSDTDPERVFLEIINEPEMKDRYRWLGVQAKLAAAIRTGAPQHTIIATGARYSADDELLFLEPLPDKNVIYNFHFYEPHVFTHQGATWGVNFWHEVGGLTYPSSRDSASAAASKVAADINRLYVMRYGAEHWDADRIEMEIGQVSAWAERNHVLVTCNEFGVYRKGTDPQSRAAWLHDVRIALERHNMGWTMWDYSGAFGVVEKKDGHATADEVTLRALGLK